MNLLRVDVGKLETTMQAIPPQHEGLGGRGLGAKVLLEEVDPTCHPLGAKNKIIFAGGLMPTSRVSSAGRLSVISKSPLTGTIKETNAGGPVVQMLARLGIRAIIVEGTPQKDHYYLLRVGKKGAQLVAADDLKGKGNYALAKELLARYGDKISIIAVGPAGENGLSVSSVVCTDNDGDPSRVAARGGLGAVMASKGLKAIVVEDNGEHKLEIRNEKAFREAVKRFHQALLDHPLLGKMMPTMGTPSGVMIINEVGGLPTRNFREGTFEKAEAISGQTLQKLVHSRGGAGRFGMTCMPGCVIRCTHAFADEKGNEVVRALEYETLGMMGSNLAVGDLDAIARFNRLCNDYGMDTIEIGGALGVAAEAGLFEFGDAARIEELLHEIGEGTILGRLLGAGAAITAKTLGVKRAPCTKGQAIGAYDPRAVKGMGVTYATSPMGGDHTAGHPGLLGVDHHTNKGQVDVSRLSQIARTAYDTLGLCVFMAQATLRNPALIVDVFNGVYGTQHGPEYIAELGKEVLRMELAFNRAAGFSIPHDRLPEFFREEKLPPYDLVFDIPDEELDTLHNY